MNLKKYQVFLGVVALLAIGFGLGVLGSRSNAVGATAYDVLNQAGDIYQGLSHTLFARNGVLLANVSSSNATVTTFTANGLSVLKQGVSGDADGALPGITTSTIGSVTAAIICQNPVIDIKLGVNNKTITLPSSSAMFSACLSTVGNIRTFTIQNASGAGNFTVAISDQSSTLKNFVVATSTTLNGTSSLNFGDVAELKAIRTTSSTSNWLNWIITVFH